MGAYGPAENFFKIKEELWDPNDPDEWYYVACTPASGPYQGSLQPGTELDKAGRYKIINVNGKTQFWRYDKGTKWPHQIAAPTVPGSR